MRRTAFDKVSRTCKITANSKDRKEPVNGDREFRFLEFIICIQRQKRQPNKDELDGKLW